MKQAIGFAAAALILASAAGPAQALTQIEWSGSQGKVWADPWTASMNTIAGSPLRWDASDTGLWFKVYFEGRTDAYMNAQQNLPGLAASLRLELLGVDAITKKWTFGYEATNASNNLNGNLVTASQLSIFGFDVYPDEKTVGLTGFFTNYAQDGQTPGISEVGTLDLCFKSKHASNCTGGSGNPSGSVSAGATKTGTFTLGFQNQPNELVLTDPYVRFQGINFTNGNKTITGASGVSRVVGVVPEPETWAMMILGFFGLGALLRRRQPLTSNAFTG